MGRAGCRARTRAASEADEWLPMTRSRSTTLGAIDLVGHLSARVPPDVACHLGCRLICHGSHPFSRPKNKKAANLLGPRPFAGNRIATPAPILLRPRTRRRAAKCFSAGDGTSRKGRQRMKSCADCRGESRETSSHLQAAANFATDAHRPLPERAPASTPATSAAPRVANGPASRACATARCCSQLGARLRIDFKANNEAVAHSVRASRQKKRLVTRARAPSPISVWS